MLVWHSPVNPKSPYPRSSTKKTIKLGGASVDDDVDLAVTVTRQKLLAKKHTKTKYNLPMTTLLFFHNAEGLIANTPQNV